jgi:hypothetical protein
MESNYTISVNYPKTEFGCTRTCSYCNWKNSPFLPNGIQSDETIVNFIKQCKKNFITISGGGDPLFHVEIYGDTFKRVCKLIRDNGFMVRVITREIEAALQMQEHVDLFSFSMDAKVYRQLSLLSKFKTRLETSLVLPSSNGVNATKSINDHYMPWVHSMLEKNPILRQLPLVLRENLNSLVPLDYDALIKPDNCRLVHRELCLSGRYLCNREYSGYEITPDYPGILANVKKEKAFIFGGLLKNMMAPHVHSQFNDIDIVIGPNAKIETFCNGFYIKQTKTIRDFIYYNLINILDSNLTLHIMQVPDPEFFISTFQLDIDRTYHDGANLHLFNGMSEVEYISRLEKKEANLLPVDPRRVINKQAVLMYFNKLKKKGWVINGLPETTTPKEIRIHNG